MFKVPMSVEERIAIIETRLDRMQEDVHNINTNIVELKALANQGRGSLRTFLWLGGLMTALITLLATVVPNFQGFN